MVSGPEFSREDRIVKLVKLSERLLLMELPEGRVVHEVRWAGGQPLDGYVAPGDQPMLSAATAHNQIVLKKRGHGEDLLGVQIVGGSSPARLYIIDELE
jgi:hypothetical protein